MLTRLRTNSRQLPPTPPPSKPHLIPFLSPSSARIVVAGRARSAGGALDGARAAPEEEEDSDDVAVFAEEGQAESDSDSSAGSDDAGGEVKRGRQPLLKKAECIRLGLCHVCRCSARCASLRHVTRCCRAGSRVIRAASSTPSTSTARTSRATFASRYLLLIFSCNIWFDACCNNSREQTGHNTRDCPFRKAPGGSGDKGRGGDGGGGLMKQLLMREGGIGRIDMRAVVERRVAQEQWHVDAGTVLIVFKYPLPIP
jgi:hypothetical protein